MPFCCSATRSLQHFVICVFCVSLQVPAIQVFGIDITHPGKVPGARSKAAVVGSTDPAFCRYGPNALCTAGTLVVLMTACALGQDYQ